MNMSFSKRISNISAVLFFIFLFSVNVMADTYTATTMQLLHYEGSVDIEDASGKSSPVMDNSRINSGNMLHTGAESNASVGLDPAKTVTLDENTKVKFTKCSNSMELFLSQGSFFLDVSEKLGRNETLDIKTKNITVDIRGTIMVLSTYSLEEYQNKLAGKAASLSSLEKKILKTSDTSGGVVSVIGVLEGSVDLDYRDETGRSVSLKVSPGQKATLLDSDDNGNADQSLEVTPFNPEDLFDAANKAIQESPGLQSRIQNAVREADSNSSAAADNSSAYPADGDWACNDSVTIIAQSASKMFDGEPLTSQSNVLVQGLPSGLTYRATASGSQTDVGSSENPIQSFAIYNRNGENVTSHFTDLQTVSGKLIVDPAPLTALTGSATKPYDGTELTSMETKLTFSPGYEKIDNSVKNLSYTITSKESLANQNATAINRTGVGIGFVSSANQSGQPSTPSESQPLYGICGKVLVHGSNPLTEEIKETYLAAGQKLTVQLSDKEQKASIEYIVETITEEEIPEDILRIYAENPDIRSQACSETDWDSEKLTRLIRNLPPIDANSISAGLNGVKMDSKNTDNLMEDCTNLLITIDTKGTDYNNRALNKEEVHYMPMQADPSISIKPDASITNVGSTSNSFKIDWGTANKDNYILSEKPGTLTVEPAPLIVMTGSAQKEYDGTPLSNSEAYIIGLVNGETATVTGTGSITKIGSTVNPYSIKWGTANSSNYTLSETIGTLIVTANNSTKIIFTAPSNSKTYDGKALHAGKVTVSGLPQGHSFKASASGSQTDAGSSESTVASYKIFDSKKNDVTANFNNVRTVTGTLTVNPAAVTVTTDSASKAYDGIPLTSSKASISGLTDADKDTVKIKATGSITRVGSTDNSYSIDWGSAKSGNYTLSEKIGTLKVTKNSTEITFKAPSRSKIYDGKALRAGDVTVSGLPKGLSYKASASGSQTDTGSSKSTVASFKILDSSGNDVTANFTNIKLIQGTLTIKPLDVIFDLNSLDTVFSGENILPDSIKGTYGDDSEIEEAYHRIVLDDYGNPVRLIYGFNLTGDGEIEIYVDAYSDVGICDYVPVQTFTTGSESNYQISYINTNFKIEPLALSIDLGSPKVTYDSSMHGGSLTVKYENGPFIGETIEPYKIKQEQNGILTCQYKLPADADITVVAGNGGPNAGTYTLSCTNSFASGDPDNYKLNVIGNKLIINARKVSVETGSAEAAYDENDPNRPVTNSEAAINTLAPNDKDRVKIKATGSQTQIGSSVNTYSIDWGDVNPDNYILEEHLGTLTKTAPSSETGSTEPGTGRIETPKNNNAGKTKKNSNDSTTADKKSDSGNKDKVGSSQSDDKSKKEEKASTQSDKAYESKDSKTNQSDVTSDSKNSKEDQPKQPSENTSKPSDSTEESKKEEASEESKEDASSSKTVPPDAAPVVSENKEQTDLKEE